MVARWTEHELTEWYIHALIALEVFRGVFASARGVGVHIVGGTKRPPAYTASQSERWRWGYTYLHM